MSKLKISFIVPANNEEKSIDKTLNSILLLMYQYYRLLTCLEIYAKKINGILKKQKKISNNLNHYNLRGKVGKSEVIDRIIKKYFDNMMIGHDSDWIFKGQNNKDLKLFLSFFNKETAGIEDSFFKSYETKEGLILRI